VSFRIQLPVGFRDGTFPISGEVIPEMLEISPLAPLDQREWHFTMEVEVPQVPHEPDILPIANAQKKSVHQHKAFGLLRELRCVGVSHHQSDVVTYDACALKT